MSLLATRLAALCLVLLAILGGAEAAKQPKGTRGRGMRWAM